MVDAEDVSCTLVVVFFASVVNEDVVDNVVDVIVVGFVLFGLLVDSCFVVDVFTFVIVGWVLLAVMIVVFERVDRVCRVLDHVRVGRVLIRGLVFVLRNLRVG